MNKLSSDFLKEFAGGKFLGKELVILPPNCDVGFNEYFEMRAEEVWKAKRLFSPIEQNKLMLAYPGCDTTDAFAFERFFESPEIVARNREFQGYFAIDITDYIGKTSSEQFRRLTSFVRDNSNAVYMFFIYSNNTNEIDNMLEALSMYDDVRRVDIPLPNEKTLTDYTIDKIRDFCLHVEKPIYDYLQRHYESKQYGYDYADSLVRRLKNENRPGDLEVIKNAVAKTESSWKAGNKTGFGY